MLIFIAVVCVLLEAFYTALEVSLGAVSRARLRMLEEADRTVSGSESSARSTSTTNGLRPPPSPAAIERLASQAGRVLQLLEHPERLSLLFITVTSLTLWTASALLTWEVVVDQQPIWMLIVALVGVLFVAEALPLLVAARHAEGIALRCARLAEIGLVVLAPLLWLLGGMGRSLARVLGASHGATPQVTESELRTALAAAEEEGVIESDERAMIEGAMDFREKLVREVMTARLDIVAIEAGATLTEVLQAAVNEGHSRLPVYEGTLDRIVGIVAAKDLIPHLQPPLLNGAEPAANGSSDIKTARDVCRPPFFIPENKRIAPTLEELRHQRTLMAIVVGSDGSTSGLVTLEDLLEQIVGEIQDEYDVEEPEMRVVTAPDDGQIHAVASDASVSVRDFERFWHRSFDERARLLDREGEDVDPSLTLADVAFELFESVPQPGDHTPAGVVVKPDHADRSYLEIRVLTMDGPRIEEIQVEECPGAFDDN